MPRSHAMRFHLFSLLFLIAVGALPAHAADTSAPANETPAVPGALPPELWQAGWISLFDGETLFGWQKNEAADWKVDDGAIVVTGGERSLLCTTTEFADYELHVEFKAGRDTNSGVFLRTPAKPADPAADCYEVNIAPADNPFPTGGLVDREKAQPIEASDDWQSFDITARGGTITVKHNGREVLKYEDPRPLKSGFIGLQHNAGRVAFRNIRLRPLGLEPIFNGRTLEGWKEYPEFDSEVRVTDSGEMQILNGSGQIETERSYGNFLLQLECRTNGKHLNSGVFFRCIPGEKMNGYESQIHNGYLNGDRTKPVDAGTGAIFRRQNARIVAADDNAWFGKTIIANGPHIAVWVNGLQVTDWTDTRPPHANPRSGLRLESGTIILQGHDPTTDLLFRNFRIRELPQQAESE